MPSASSRTTPINSDSHNKIAAKTVNIGAEVVYDQNNKRSTDQVAATNQFGFAEGGVTYLSRADGFKNYAEATAAPKSFELAEEYKKDYVNFLCRPSFLAVEG